MSIDDRLREGLHREALLPDPDVRTRMERATRTARRRSLRDRVASGIAIVFLCGAVLGIARVVRAPTEPARPATVTPVSGVSSIDGVWRARITIGQGLRAGMPLGQARRTAGSWVLILADGLIRAVHEGSFETVPLSGTFSVEGSTIVVMPREPDGAPGAATYRWSLVDGALTFGPTAGDGALDEGMVVAFSQGRWRLEAH